MPITPNHPIEIASPAKLGEERYMEEPQVISEVYSSEDWGTFDGAFRACVKRREELDDRGYQTWSLAVAGEDDSDFSLRGVKWPEPTRIKPSER